MGTLDVDSKKVKRTCSYSALLPRLSKRFWVVATVPGLESFQKTREKDPGALAGHPIQLHTGGPDERPGGHKFQISRNPTIRFKPDRKSRIENFKSCRMV